MAIFNSYVKLPEGIQMCLYVLSVSERLLNGVCLRSVVSLQLLFVHRLSFPAKNPPGTTRERSVPLGTWLGSWYHGYISVYINDIIWWEYNSLSPIEKEESKISLHDIRMEYDILFTLRWIVLLWIFMRM